MLLGRGYHYNFGKSIIRTGNLDMFRCSNNLNVRGRSLVLYAISLFYGRQCGGFPVYNSSMDIINFTKTQFLH